MKWQRKGINMVKLCFLMSESMGCWWGGLCLWKWESQLIIFVLKFWIITSSATSLWSFLPFSLNIIDSLVSASSFERQQCHPYCLCPVKTSRTICSGGWKLGTEAAAVFGIRLGQFRGYEHYGLFWWSCRSHDSHWSWLYYGNVLLLWVGTFFFSFLKYWSFMFLRLQLLSCVKFVVSP